ncbi:MAG: hypothetical protein PHC99_07540 [Methylococcales bacterium]|nr:hypothetical protein [Methylococcales bacterium]
MRHWHTFKETMNHEMEDVDINLSKKGYKLDGRQGIKLSIKVNQYKSVDYIADDVSLSLVEFSDLYRDQHRVNNALQEVLDSNITEDSVNMIKRTLESQVQKDLVSKFKDSISIIIQMQKINFCDELSHYTENNSRKSIKYVIVIAPFHPSIPNNKRVELARVISQLKNNVTSGLPQAINARANVILLDEYARQ